MYKVFFTDDEAAMRAGIRNNIEWDNSVFSLVGEASDGELALPLMQELMPDVLITDVRMPFMDGIELSRRAKKAMPWIKIIILSGHDEFEYAKQAITIGIQEYLLKPITSEKLLEALGRVAAVIDAEREESKNIERLLDDTRHVQMERLLSGLLYKNVGVDEALLMAEKLGVSINSDYYLVLLFELHVSSRETYAFIQEACACALGVLDEWGDAIYCNQGWNRILCVLKGMDKAVLEEEAYTCAQAVKYEAERDSACSVSVAIGSIVSGIEQWLSSLADADKAKRYLDLVNRRQIISVQDIRIGGLMPTSGIKKLPAKERLRYIVKDDLPQFLEDYFSSFGSISLSSFLLMNYVFVDILMSASALVEELGGDPKDVLSEYWDISGILTSGSSSEANKSMLSSVLSAAIDYRDSFAVTKYYDVISKAQDYIRLNYDKHDVSLHSVALEVNMSPNHFSTVFSQETGETFINYLTQIRMEHAKALLKTTSMRTSDIGYAVGYNDTHYFSYVFKKNTGMTPTEFRK